MSIQLKVPKLGESITSVEIGSWLKSEGDAVARDEALVELETDKATVELPSPVAGVLTKIGKQKGDSAQVGDVIGEVEEGASPAVEPQPPTAAESQASTAKPAAKTEAKAEKPESKPAPKSTSPAAPARADAGRAEQESRVMPGAARLMADHDLKPGDVHPTGPGGRVLKEDVLRQVAAKPPPDEPIRQAVGSPKESEARATPSSPESPVSGAPPAAGAQEEIVAMTPMRRKIAERLVTAQQNAALLTTFNEVDMTAVVALRQELRDEFQKKHGVKLGFMSFFVKAAVEALKACPQLNAEVRGTDIVYRNHYDIGIAVGGGRGLVVPVLKGAQQLSFAEIERAIAGFASRAQENKLKPDELSGGTFTISNGGVYGSLLSTPIVNPPQSGILGLHAIQDRPVARDGAVVIRPMMYVALTYDHRIVDGRESVTFLKKIKDLVETPPRMMLEV